MRERERERERERITDTRYGSENQTKKNELARTGIEPMAFGLALRRSNHWATETPHLNHHIQVRYHRTADNVAVAWLSGCSDPKLGMAARVRYSPYAFSTRRRVFAGTSFHWPSMNEKKLKIERLLFSLLAMQWKHARREKSCMVWNYHRWPCKTATRILCSTIFCFSSNFSPGVLCRNRYCNPGNFRKRLIFVLFVNSWNFWKLIAC